MADNARPPEIMITTSNTITIVTPGMVYVFDKKTGKLIKKWPEMEDPIPVPHIMAALETLHATEDLKGVDDLRTHAVKLLVAAVDKVAAEVEKKTAREVVEA
jgi:hypothetical protein